MKRDLTQALEDAYQRAVKDGRVHYVYGTQAAGYELAETPPDLRHIGAAFVCYSVHKAGFYERFPKVPRR